MLATPQHQDTMSIGSEIPVSKSEFETFQSKLAKDMEANLKEWKHMASSITDEASMQSFVEAIRTEWEAAAKEKVHADKEACIIWEQVTMPAWNEFSKWIKEWCSKCKL